jgi:hypothetical protein
VLPINPTVVATITTCGAERCSSVVLVVVVLSGIFLFGVPVVVVVVLDTLIFVVVVVVVILVGIDAGVAIPPVVVTLAVAIPACIVPIVAGFEKFVWSCPLAVAIPSFVVSIPVADRGPKVVSFFGTFIHAGSGEDSFED